MSSKGILIGVAIVIIVIGVIAILGHYTGPSTTSYPTTLPGQQSSIQSSGQQTPVFLTDPPVVPIGTTALVLAYSSVRVHESGTSAGGWIDASGSGNINLLSLVNTSEVIGTANVLSNSTIDMISFNVTSATITINGTTSNVTIPARSITAHVVGSSKVNATSGVLLDFSPTIATIYTANSTVFVMVPSVRAIVIGNRNVSVSSSIGAKETLNQSEKKTLEDTKPNISIVSSSISVTGNSTEVSVAVKDNSNSSVVLRHVSVFGNYSVVVAPSAGFNTAVHIEDNGSISESNGNGGNNASNSKGNNESNSSNNKGAGIITSENVNVTLNVTNIEHHKGNSNSKAEGEANATNQSNAESYHISEGIDAQHARMFNFMINQNGTLSLPSVSGEVEGQDLGYNLTAGSTATFTFNGELNFGEGHITIIPNSGFTYNLVVSGEEDSSASANATAK